MSIRLLTTDNQEVLCNALGITAAQSLNMEMSVQDAGGGGEGQEILTRVMHGQLGKGAFPAGIVVPKPIWQRSQRYSNDKVIGMSTCDDTAMAAAMVSAAARCSVLPFCLRLSI